MLPVTLACCDYDRALADGTARPDSVEYFSGEEQPGRVDKLKIELPPAIRAPSTFCSEPYRVRRLFPDFADRERDYFRRPRLFPIMHVVALCRALWRENPWMAQSLFKAFTASQAITYEGLQDTAALRTRLPWQTSVVEETRREMGEDWWPYGLPNNRHVPETFLRYHHEQGLSKRLLKPEEVFAPQTLEEFRI